VLEKEAFGLQDVIDGFQHLLGQFVFLQAVTEPQDGALIGKRVNSSIHAN